MPKTSAKRSRGAQSRQKIPEDDPYYVAAKFIRNNKKHKLEVGDGVLQQRRCEYFRGVDFIEAIQELTITGAESLKAKNESDAKIVGSKMIKMGFFRKAGFDEKSKKNKNLKHDNVMTISTGVQKMEQDGLYVWVLPRDMGNVWMYSALLVAFALFICLIKVWPLWLKIAVWWVSLILLVSICAIIALRLVLYLLFFIVGVRDIWLLPDFLDDDVDFLDALTPLFGRGHIKEAQLKKKAKKAGEEYVEPSVSFSFGAANLAGMLSLGLVLCWYGGFFKGENIPDFLAGRDEIWNNYAFLLDETAYVPEEDATETPHPAQETQVAPDDDGIDIDAMIDEDVAMDLDEEFQHGEL